MATDYDTARDQYDNYRFCYDNGHETFIQKASVCFNFWNGEQWEAAVKARLEREGRPALTFNVIESLVRAAKGVQRALRNDVRFTPFQDASMDDAKVRDAIWLDVQANNQLDFLETDVYESGLIMSRAYYDVRMDYTDSLTGVIKVRKRRSQDVVLDPSVDEYDPDSWPQVITRRWVSYQDLVMGFGKEKADAVGTGNIPNWFDYEDQFMAQQMGQMPYYRHASLHDMDIKRVRGLLLLERQYFDYKRKEVFVDLQTGDWKEIPENWDRERIARVLEQVEGLGTMYRNVKTIRWVTTCEDEVLHQEDSPYNHFTIVPYFPTFLDGITKGAVEGLIDPQMLYNKMTSSELHTIVTTANSGYKLKAGSLKNMTVEELEANGSRSGIVFELDDVGHLEKIPPNQLPQGHDRLSFKADQIMRQLSGVSNQMRGFAREDVASEAILSNQAAAEVNFAGWLGNLHRTKQLLARNVNDLASTHYTETRTLLINRGSAFLQNMQEVVINQPTPEGEILNNVTRGKFNTVLVPAPSRASLSEADFSLLLKLRTEVGVAIPDAMLIELSPASNKAAIIEMLSGGPDSNERAREAEEAEAAQRAAEAQKQQAIALKEQAAAQLNQARAEKFAIEAASDPDASYERVEMARIQAEREDREAERELRRQQLENTRTYQDKQIALRLTEIEHHSRERAAERDAASQEARPGLKRRGKEARGKSE